MASNLKTITVVIAGLLVLLFLWSFLSARNTKQPAAGQQITTTPISTFYETKTSDEGNVVVDVIPQTLIVGQPPSFEITFTTHSGSMDFAVEKIAVLTDGKGTNYDSPAWDGSPPGGHHRSGTLTFKKPLANAGPVSLVLQNIAQVPTRKFIWQIP